MTTIDISVRRQIQAPASTVYATVSDVANLGELSPENVSSQWLDSGHGAAVGRRFVGRNRLGWLSWSTKPVVTVADDGRRFAFRVPSGARTTWTYDLEPTDGGTLVTESVRTERAAPAMVRFLMRLGGVTDRTEHLRAGMTETLERLAERVETRVPAP